VRNGYFVTYKTEGEAVIVAKALSDAYADGQRTAAARVQELEQELETIYGDHARLKMVLAETEHRAAEARREGMEAMRERAAKACEATGRATNLTQAVPVTAFVIAAAIRSLPLPAETKPATQRTGGAT